MPNLSTLLNNPDPQASIFGLRTAQAQAAPTTGEVAGAFIQEMFLGEGSLYQDIRARNIEKAEEAQPPITEEDWKLSDNYRPGLTWHEGLTQDSAKTLAEIEDDRRNRGIITEKASGWQAGIGYAASLTTGLLEPKNLLSGIAVGIATAGLGFAVPTIGRALAVTTVRGAVARGAGEGVLAAALVEPSNLESSRIVQGDYTLSDSLVNFGLSAILGGGASGISKKLQLRKATRTDIALKEFDTALAQVTQGEAIEVSHVKQIETAREITPLTTLSKEQIAEEPAIIKVGKNEYEALYPDEQGRLSEARGLGKTADEAIFDLKEQYNTPLEKIKSIDETTRLNIADTTALDELKTQIANQEAIFDEKLRNRGFPIDEYKKEVSARNDYLEARAKERESVPEDKIKQFDKETDATQSKMQERISEFATQKNQQLFTQAKTEADAQIQAIKQQISNLERAIQKRSVRAVSKDIMPKVVDDATRPDNSTIFDEPDLVEKMEARVKEIISDDDLALEKELEYLDGELKAMEEEGMLTYEDRQYLEKLAAIEEEGDIFDNIYNSARLCLTRG